MKKNSLYTVTPWNRNIFAVGGGMLPMPEGYNLGSLTPKISSSQKDWKLPDWMFNNGQLGKLVSGQVFNLDEVTAVAPRKKPVGNIELPGFSLDTPDLNKIKNIKADSPLAKDISTGVAKGMGKAALNAGIGAAAGIVGGLASNWIGGGYDAYGVGNGVTALGSTVGQAVGNVNPVLGAAITVGSGIVGGGINRLWGMKTDQKALNRANSDIAAMNSFTSNASTFDNVEGPQSVQQIGKVYRGGVFKKGSAQRKNDKLRRDLSNAVAFANDSVENNVNNLQSDQMNNLLANYSAFGGPLGIMALPMPNTQQGGALSIMQQDKYIDAINNRSNAIAKNNTAVNTSSSFSPLGNAFADGGGIHIKPSHKGLFTEKANRAGMGVQAYASHVLANKEDYPSSTVKQANFARNSKSWGKHDAGGSLEGAFLDEFGKDPLGAVMRYNQGLEAMAAQREAEAAAVAQQAAYDDMQKRMIDAETERQSLQSMLDSQGLTIQALMEQQRQNNYADGWKERMGDAVDNTVTSTSSLVGNAADKNKNWQYIKKRLKASGKFNDTQIEGIKLNLQRESGFNWKDRSGDSGKAWGLAQWHEPRRPKDMSFDGQINHLIDTLYNYDGKNHWIGKDNYNGFMNARTPEEAHYFIAKGWERPASEILTGLKDASDRSLRKHAFGGELGTNGTDFTTGLLEINTGNSHEENPHEGVQLGFDEQGIPNLVEEGETVYNDYVFSNRLKVPAFMRRQLGLGGSMKDEITFAAASKKIAEAGKERPNNPMDMDYMDDALGKLAQVQEAERMRMHAEETNDEMERINAMPMEGMMQGAMGLQAANGGRLNKYDKGGKPNTIQKSGDMFADINNYPYEPIKEFEYWDTNTNDYKPKYRNFIENILNEDWIARVMRGDYGDMSRYLGANNSNPTLEQARALGLDTRYSDWHKAFAAAYEDYLKGIDPVTGEATLPEVEVAASNRSTNNYPQTYWGPGVDNTSFWTAAQQAGYTGLPEVDWRGNAGAKAPVYVPEGATAESIGVQAPMEVPSVLEERRKDPNDPMNAGVKGNNGERKPYATWMRYAPAVGTGIMTLTDLLGLTNRPDYTYADKIEAAANRAGYAPSIRYTPIGDYMTYRPLDRLFYANQLQANSRATDRALANTSGGNRGTAQAAMIANGYNTNNNLGNLYRQAEEYNLAQREKVADFNRRTNMFNSQMGLEADMANARYRQQAANAQLSGLAQAAAMRDSIDQRVGAARSANITNLLNNLGNIGRENFAMNQINYDRTRPYKGRLNGTSYYYNGSAFGGEIERNKKNKKQGRRSK